MKMNVASYAAGAPTHCPMLFIILIFLSVPLLFIAAYVWIIYRFAKNRLYFLAAAFLILPFLTIEAFQYYWFAKAIPEKIGITYPISINDDGGLMGGCGTAVFKLSDTTLEAIKKDGLQFFVGATQGRGYAGNPYYHYEEWMQTPLPPSWTSEGSWMACSGLSRSEHSKIVSAAKASGAYYTIKPEGQMVLVPSLGYVVFSFFG